MNTEWRRRWQNSHPDAKKTPVVANMSVNGRETRERLVQEVVDDGVNVTGQQSLVKQMSVFHESFAKLGFDANGDYVLPSRETLAHVKTGPSSVELQ